MQNRPIIKTAIPKHRYQIGSFSASVLGDIESGDTRTYRFILAFVAMGQGQPSFYVCAEQGPTASEDAGFDLRVVNEAMSEVVDTDPRWGDLEYFAEQALKLGAQALGLQREQVVRLM